MLFQDISAERRIAGEIKFRYYAVETIMLIRFHYCNLNSVITFSNF